MRAIESRPSRLNLYVARAPADDDEAIMLIICSVVPSPAYLCATVEAEYATDLDEETETVHFLRQVGREIVIFWIPGVTEAEAAAIRVACEPIKRWSVEAFTTAVGRAMGGKVQRLQ
jgi:hypothetical protein